MTIQQLRELYIQKIKDADNYIDHLTVKRTKYREDKFGSGVHTYLHDTKYIELSSLIKKEETERDIYWQFVKELDNIY